MSESLESTVSNLSKRVVTVSAIADIAIRSNLFTNQIKEISRQNSFDIRSNKAAIIKGMSSGTFTDSRRPGRPLLLDTIDDAALEAFVNEREGNVTRENILDQFNHAVSQRTLSNTLHRLGYYSFRKIRYHMLTEGDKQVRLSWCRSKEHWNLDTWRLVCFSDESTFGQF